MNSQLTIKESTTNFSTEDFKHRYCTVSLKRINIFLRTLVSPQILRWNFGQAESSFQICNAEA